MKTGAMALLLGGVSLAALSMPAQAANIEAEVGVGTTFNGTTDFTPVIGAPAGGNQNADNTSSPTYAAGNFVNQIIDPVLADLNVVRSRLTYSIGVDANFVAPPNQGGTAVVSGIGVGANNQVRPRITSSQRRINANNVTNSTVRFDNHDVTAQATGISGAVQHIVRGTIAGNPGQPGALVGDDFIQVFDADFVALNLQNQDDGRVRAIVRRDGGNGNNSDIEEQPIGIRVRGDVTDSLLDVSANSVNALTRVNALETDITIDAGLGGSDVTIFAASSQYSQNQTILASNRRFNVGVNTPTGNGSDEIRDSNVTVTNNILQSDAVVNDGALTINGDLNNAALDGIRSNNRQWVDRDTGDVNVTALVERNFVGLALNADAGVSDELIDSNVMVRGNTTTARAAGNRFIGEVVPDDLLGVAVDAFVSQDVRNINGGALDFQARQGPAGANNFAGTRFGVRVEDDDISGSTIDVSNNSASAEVVVNERTVVLGLAAAVQAVLDFEGTDPVDLDLLLNAAAITDSVALDVDFRGFQGSSGGSDNSVSALAHLGPSTAAIFEFDNLRSSAINIAGNSFAASVVWNDSTTALAPLRGPIQFLGDLNFGTSQNLDDLVAVSEVRRSLIGLYGGAGVGGLAADQDVTLTVSDNVVVSQLIANRQLIDIMGVNGPISGAGGIRISANGSVRDASFTAMVGRLSDNTRVGARLGLSTIGAVGGEGSDVTLALQNNGIFADVVIFDYTLRVRTISANITENVLNDHTGLRNEDIIAVAGISNVGFGITDMTGLIGGSSGGIVNVGLRNNIIRAQLVGTHFQFALEELSGNVSDTGVIDFSPDTTIEDAALDSVVRNVAVGVQTMGNVGGADAPVSLQVTDFTIESNVIASRNTFAVGDMGSSQFGGRLVLGADAGNDQELDGSTLRANIGVQADGTGTAADGVRVGLLDANDILGGDVDVTLTGVNVFANTTGAVYEGSIARLGIVTDTGQVNLGSLTFEDPDNGDNSLIARTANVTIGIDAPAGTLEGANLVLNNIRVGANASAVEASQNVVASSGTIAGQLVLSATQNAEDTAVQAALGADGQPVIVGAVLQTTSGAGLDTIISGTRLSATARGGTVSQIVSGISGAVTGSIALAANQSRTGGSISATATNATIGVNTTLGNGTSIIRGSGIGATAVGNSATGSIGN